MSLYQQSLDRQKLFDCRGYFADQKLYLIEPIIKASSDEELLSIHLQQGEYYTTTIMITKSDALDMAAAILKHFR